MHLKKRLMTVISFFSCRDEHPIIPVIKEHRTLSKLLNSTLGSICTKSQLCLKSQKYIIKGHWLQTSTATGRLSMEEPNLQVFYFVYSLLIKHKNLGYRKSFSKLSDIS